jgi:hypothetical protein
MQIEFSNHAMDQLKVRSRITKQMVVNTVTVPDEVEDSFKNRKLYRKKFETDTLEVVTISEDNKVIIITEYILDQSE